MLQPSVATPLRLEGVGQKFSDSAVEDKCNSSRSLGLHMRIYIDEAGLFVPPNPPRRALNNQLQFPGWKDFGGLLVRHWQAGDGFIQLGPGGDIPMVGHAREVCQALHSRAKDMITERNRNARTPRT